MARAIALRDAAYLGDHSQLQWLYHRMLKSSPTLAALRLRRQAAIQRLDWDILTPSLLPPGATHPMAHAQAAALRHAYQHIQNLRQALSFLTLAPFHGFAHLQKIRDPQGRILRLQPLDQWNWIRDGYRGPWLWNPSAQSVTADALRQTPGATIDPDEFLILQNDLPILEALLGPFIKELLGAKDWTHYIDIYGIPSAFIIGPQGVPPGSQIEADYKLAAQIATAGGGGYLPFGSILAFADAPRQHNPFKQYLDDLRSQMILAGTGGKLTMLAQPGSGTLAAGAHQDAFDQIAQAEAADISQAFQRSLDRPILSALFPGQPPLAYFRLAPNNQTDPAAQAALILKLAQAGYQVHPAQVAQRTGYTVTLQNTPPAIPAPDAQPAQPAQPAQHAP
jgi:phage gp29-like protein